jgi:hypothetical protein
MLYREHRKRNGRFPDIQARISGSAIIGEMAFQERNRSYLRGEQDNEA